MHERDKERKNGHNLRNDLKILLINVFIVRRTNDLCCAYSVRLTVLLGLFSAVNYMQGTVSNIVFGL